MRPSATHVARSVVSVGIGHTGDSCRSGRTDRDVVRLQTRVDLGNHALDGVQIPHPHEKGQCWRGFLVVINGRVAATAMSGFPHRTIPRPLLLPPDIMQFYHAAMRPTRPDYCGRFAFCNTCAIFSPDNKHTQMDEFAH